jgi:hypothetical protein
MVEVEFLFFLLSTMMGAYHTVEFEVLSRIDWIDPCYTNIFRTAPSYADTGKLGAPLTNISDYIG